MVKATDKENWANSQKWNMLLDHVGLAPHTSRRIHALRALESQYHWNTKQLQRLPKLLEYNQVRAAEEQVHKFAQYSVAIILRVMRRKMIYAGVFKVDNEKIRQHFFNDPFIAKQPPIASKEAIVACEAMTNNVSDFLDENKRFHYLSWSDNDLVLNYSNL